MSPGPVDFDSLEPSVQAELRAKLGVDTPVRQEAIVAQQAKRAAGQKRQKTGKDFESEIDVTCAAYEFRKQGKIRRNYVPTRMVGKGKRVAAGPAHVDRTGWVSVYQWHNGWHGAEYFAIGSAIIPLAFDCKVHNHAAQRSGWYRHDRDLQHQLHDLKAAADAGEYAFLLILSPKLGRLFAVPILPHYQALLKPDVGVQLYDHDRDDVPLLPSITKRGAEIGWDFIPLLQHCAPR